MKNEKIKKILLIVGFLSFIFFVGFLIWRLFFKQTPVSSPVVMDPETTIFDGLPTSPDGTPITAGNEKESPLEVDDYPQNQEPQEAQKSDDSSFASPIAVGGLTLSTTIVNSPSLKPTIGMDGNSIQFYDKNSGQFYKINKNGEPVLLNDAIIKNASNIEWAPSKTKAVLEFPDKTKVVYDFESNKQISLPSHWEDFTFSPDSKKLVNKTIGTDSDNNWLIVSNSDGSQSKSLEKIGINSDSIIPYWSPDNQSVAMYTKSINIDKKEVVFIGEHGQNFKSIVVEGQNFQPQWSESGEKLLYSVNSSKDGSKPNLWVISANGGQPSANKKSLEIETWAEKCTFVSSSEVYCAVPKYLKADSGIFSETMNTGPDDIYKINIETGQKTLIAIPDKGYNISSIIVDKDQSNLFFTDSGGGAIHKIKL